MTAVTFELRGTAQFESTIASAAKAIADMRDGFAGAARELAALSTSAAPRRTGRLASSLRPGGGKTAGWGQSASASAPVTSPLVYAVPIHWGRPAHNIAANPFIFAAANRNETKWLAPLESAAQKVCDGVHGA